MRKGLLEYLRRNCWELLGLMEKDAVRYEALFEMAEDIQSEMENYWYADCVVCEASAEFLTVDGMMCEECCKKRFGVNDVIRS